MRLVSLDMIGFKSFADKTHIEFSDGITCVVGENGNGKTCILEAIVWVLGAQAGSAVRAVKEVGMGSVIFWGNGSRPRSKFAEVAIVFSNEDRALPIDTSEVEIRRRISITAVRGDNDFDTSSEYFINRQPCRLKDINELLANTGVGKNSYSILKQGEIDEILKMKPADRRVIFEEAAAISKHRMDEKEAQARLEAADANLKEVNARFSELQRQYTRLKNQAEAAANYNADRKELRGLEDKLVVLDINEYVSRKDELDKQLKRSQEKLKALEEKSKTLAQKMTESQKQASTLREEIGILCSEITAATQMRAARQQALSAFLDARTRLEELYSEMRKRRDDTIEADKKNKQERKWLEEAIAERNETLKSVEKRISDSEKESEEATEIIRSLGDKDTRYGEEKASLESDLFENYDRFVSKAHNVISSVYEEIGDSGKIKARKKAEENLLARISELKRIIGTVGPLADPDLSKARSILDEIIGLFEEYKKCGADFSKLREDSKAVEEAKKADDLVSPLFDKIRDLNKRIDVVRRSIRETSEKRNAIQLLIRSLSAEKQSVSDQLIGMSVRKSVLDEQSQSMESRLLEIERDAEAAKRNLDDNISNAQSAQREVDEFNKSIDEKIRKRDDKERAKAKIDQELIDMGNKDQVDMEELKEKIAGFKAKIEGTEELIRTKSDEYFEREGLSVKELAATMSVTGNEDMQAIRRRVQILRNQIKTYGNINYLAAEEFEGVKKDYELIKAQLDDYTKAREDLKGVLVNIRSESSKLFMRTFDKINENFNTFYSTLSRGGTASLKLEESENDLEAGVEIYACPPGKSATHVSSLSGGEKVVATLALFFAIYQIKPAPFCFLDEPVAALSEKNVNAFLTMLGDFKDTSQFIMITHNKYTLKGGNALIGVVQHEKGVSKVMSVNMKVSDDGKFLLTDRKTGRPVNIKLDG